MVVKKQVLSDIIGVNYAKNLKDVKTNKKGVGGYTEPQHDKTNKIICVHSEASDQTGHPPRLIRVRSAKSQISLDIRQD